MNPMQNDFSFFTKILSPFFSPFTASADVLLLRFTNEVYGNALPFQRYELPPKTTGLGFLI